MKILSQLSGVDRSSIKSQTILLPDKNGPILFPASSLVYDDAPWLSSRIRTLRLVHPDVGDEVREPWSAGVVGAAVEGVVSALLLVSFFRFPTETTVVVDPFLLSQYSRSMFGCAGSGRLTCVRVRRK